MGFYNLSRAKLLVDGQMLRRTSFEQMASGCWTTQFLFPHGRVVTRPDGIERLAGEERGSWRPHPLRMSADNRNVAPPDGHSN
jgi:hypothetical protein